MDQEEAERLQGSPWKKGPPQWAVSSMFIGDSDGTHQSGFDDFDEKEAVGAGGVCLVYLKSSVCRPDSYAPVLMLARKRQSTKSEERRKMLFFRSSLFVLCI